MRLHRKIIEFSRPWLALTGFAAAISWLILVLILYIHAHQYGGVALVDTNHYGEWGLEVLIIVASIVFIVYGMIDYVKLVEKSGRNGGIE